MIAKSNSRSSGWQVSMILAALSALAIADTAQAKTQYFLAISNACSGLAKNTVLSTGCPLCHVGSSQVGDGASGGNAVGSMVGTYLSGGPAAVCQALTPAVPAGPTNAHAPTLRLKPGGSKRFVHVNETLAFSVIGRDGDGDPVTVTAKTLPDGATFSGGETGRGEFSWTPTTSPDSVDVVFQATDAPDNGSDPRSSPRQKVTISVDNDQPPQLDTLASPQTVVVGRPFEMPVWASDPDANDRVKFAFATDDQGKTTKPAGAVLKPRPPEGNKYQALFAWKPKAAMAGQSIGVDFVATDVVANPYQTDQEVIFQVAPGLTIVSSKYVNGVLKVKGKVLASPAYLQQGLSVKLADKAGGSVIGTPEVGPDGVWSFSADGAAGGICTVQATIVSGAAELTTAERAVKNASGCQ